MSSPHLPLAGIAMMVIGATLLSTKDGMAKLLVADHHPLSVAWFHFAFAWLSLAPVVIYRGGLAALVPKPFGWQMLRSTFSASTVFLFFNAIGYIPLATAVSMVFIGPLLATAMAPFLLKEKVGIRRWSAVIVGLCGVVLILRPEFSGQLPGYLFGLATGVSVGLFFVVNRRTAGMAPPVESVFYSMTVGAFAFAPLQLAYWTDFTGWSLQILLLSALFALAGQSLAVLSFLFGQASLISLFHYCAIIGATAFGYAVFGSFPDAPTWTGIAIVIMSGVYVGLRGRKLAAETG